MKTGAWISTYEEQPLAGAVFNIIAIEDIYTPDHQTDGDGNRILEVIGGVAGKQGCHCGNAGHR